MANMCVSEGRQEEEELEEINDDDDEDLPGSQKNLNSQNKKNV